VGHGINSCTISRYCFAELFAHFAGERDRPVAAYAAHAIADIYKGNASSSTTEKVIPYALLGMTAVTGLVGAVSFLSLGHVFTANMTRNIVLLAFATAHVSGLGDAAKTLPVLRSVKRATIAKFR
jgi:Protein of unknown function (DUF1275)